MRLTEPGGISLDAAWTRRARDPEWASLAVTRFRDLLLFDNGSFTTVIACDANAGIGDQPADVIRQPAWLTGFGAAKVPLMEVIAAGASPIVLVNTLSCSLTGHGAEILRGIRECVRFSGHDPVITGSDESNILTVQSGVGVTVIGVAERTSLLLGGAQPDDVVVVVGTPMDGVVVPYEETDPDIVTPREVAHLVKTGLAHELLPVGSKGVAFEAGEIARTSNLSFEQSDSDVDLEISAGSSTCILLACSPSNTTLVAHEVHQPVRLVGHLRS